MKNQNVIYKQNSNWIINLSKVIINTERRIKSGVAKKPGMISIISTGISTGISKINPFKNKKETSIDKYIIQETIDDKPKLYLTIGPPLLLRTQYLEKGGYSKHNYIIEKSSINKKGGRISENNYNTAAYKIAVKLFKLTDSNKISFVFRETTKNSDKNTYKYKAELKINKKTNKKEIKLKEISNKKKI